MTRSTPRCRTSSPPAPASSCFRALLCGGPRGYAAALGFGFGMAVWRRASLGTAVRGVACRSTQALARTPAPTRHQRTQI